MTEVPLVVSERQPGGRASAPGDLGRLQSFVNTRWNLDGAHEDRFSDPDAVAAWFRAHGLLGPGVRLTEADMGRVLDVRDGLWALLFANNGAAPGGAAIGRMNAALRGGALYPALSAAGPPELVAARADVGGALALLGAIAAVAQLDGSWARLKACRGERCGWTFYDDSRNLSGSWCSMSVCGGRAKARAYRERRRR